MYFTLFITINTYRFCRIIIEKENTDDAHAQRLCDDTHRAKEIPMTLPIFFVLFNDFFSQIEKRFT